MVFVGIDIIEIDRIEAAYACYGERFLNRIYTPAERVYCRGRGPQLASRFAAKEAVMKLLGTGVRGVAWREIEIVRQRGRAPEVVLHNRAAAVAAKLGIVRIAISLAHSRQYAVASCVGETGEPA